jgi:hypothetical protein
MCGGFTFISSAPYLKKSEAGIALTCRRGGVFMSTLGSIVAAGARGVLPQSDSSVILKPSCTLWTAA